MYQMLYYSIPILFCLIYNIFGQEAFKSKTGFILTAHEITTVCPVSRPFKPAWMLMEFVQNTAKSAIYSLYIHPVHINKQIGHGETTTDQTWNTVRNTSNDAWELVMQLFFKMIYFKRQNQKRKRWHSLGIL